MEMAKRRQGDARKPGKHSCPSGPMPGEERRASFALMQAVNPNFPGELGIDATLAEKKREHGELSARAEAIKVLQEAEIPMLVGGAYAYAQYTGIFRDTKDLDLFLRKEE